MTAIKSHIVERKAWAVVSNRRHALRWFSQYKITEADCAIDERVVPCVVRYLVPVKAGKLK